MEKFNEGQDAQDIVPLGVQGEFDDGFQDYDGIAAGEYDLSDQAENSGHTSDGRYAGSDDGYDPFETLPGYHDEFDIFGFEDSLAEHSRGSVRGGMLADLGEAMRWMIRPITVGDLSKPMVTEMHETDLTPHTPEERLQAELAKKQQALVIKREDS